MYAETRFPSGCRLASRVTPYDPDLLRHTIPVDCGLDHDFRPQTLHDISPVLDVYDQDDATRSESFLWFEDRSFGDKLARDDPNLKVVFVVHGFLNHRTMEWMIDMKNALLKEPEHKAVVLVGWSRGADVLPIYYDDAAASVPLIGHWLGHILSDLKTRYPGYRIHGVGHSLGAHVLGQAGRLSQAVYRISGLDPAGPRYETRLKMDCLQQTDALEFVDVIHTDGFSRDNHYPVNHFGTLSPLGHLDFYPNYGVSPQPGAESELYEEDWTLGVGASHSRAHDLYTWTILNPGMLVTDRVLDGTPAVGAPVETTSGEGTARVEMGYHGYQAGGTVTKGNYYIKTASTEPWVS